MLSIILFSYIFIQVENCFINGWVNCSGFPRIGYNINSILVGPYKPISSFKLTVGCTV